MRILGIALLAAWGVGIAASATVAAEPPAAAAPSPKAAEFDRVLAEWKTVLADLRKLRDEHRKLREDYGEAAKGRREEIEKRHVELVQKGEQLLPKVTELAQAAFREDPKANNEPGRYLVMLVLYRWTGEDFEEALRVAKWLLENQCDDPLLHAWAGTAAFAVGEFELAEKEIVLAQQGKALEKLSGDFGQMGPAILKDIQFYKEAWPKEQAIRAAEAKADNNPRVLLKTSKGDIEVELFENEAPNTVANFISLVEKGYYNGTPFHRVLPQFMAQGGDPTGTGTGGPGYTIADECKGPNYRVHFRGTMSMAKSMAPDSGGSQFFLTFRPTHHLDGKHTAFGRVVKGIEVLAKLQRRDPEKPDGSEPDKIVEAKVLRKRNHPYEPKKITQQQ
jgi:cyclophilin family peptidyl-prolyl cis-trans isomerase